MNSLGDARPDQQTPIIPSPPAPLTLARAEKEAEAFARQNEWAMRHARWRSLRDLSLSYVLFCFVLAINIWWDYRVIGWICKSGDPKSGFHLNDSVLIALATTAVANFIGLVAIVAKNLFPAETK